MPAQMMPVRQFANLLKQAEKALKKGDTATVDAINAQIEPLGYRVRLRDGQSVLQQKNPITNQFDPESRRCALEQKDVIARLKTAWAGAHGGAIRRIEATEDPRTFVVTTQGGFNRQKANFPAHGLSYLSHQADMFSEDEHVVIRIADDLWAKLQAPAEPPTDASLSDSDAALARLAQGVTATRDQDVQIIRTLLASQQDHAVDLALDNDQLRQANTRLQVEQEQQRESIAQLQAALERLTAAPDTILIYETMSSSDMTSEKLRQKRREGYQIAFEGFINKDGTPVYCARLERRRNHPPSTPPIRMIEVPTVRQPNSNGHLSAVIDPHRQSSSLFDRLREQDDRELQPELDALDEALMGTVRHE